MYLLKNKAKKERKQDLRRANSYSDKARGENLAGSLPDEDLAAKLADKAGKKQMKSLAREAPGAKKPKDETARFRELMLQTVSKALGELRAELEQREKMTGPVGRRTQPSLCKTTPRWRPSPPLAALCTWTAAGTAPLRS